MDRGLYLMCVMYEQSAAECHLPFSLLLPSIPCNYTTHCSVQNHSDCVSSILSSDRMARNVMHIFQW